MACGTPVLTSNVSALPEVVGEGGALVDPYSTEAICEKLAELLEDQSKREELSRRGLERARRFTWPQVAEQTMRVYREILSPGPTISERTTSQGSVRGDPSAG
jgi:glycosyltransferase involved in cell wall biosynthesis